MLKTLLITTLGLGLIVPATSALTSDDEYGHEGDAERVEVEWFDGSYNAAVREAKKRDTMVLVAFVPSWSEYANGLVEEVFPTHDVAGLMSEFVCVKFDDSEARDSQQVQKLFNVESFPSLLFVGGNGRIEDTIFGFIPPEPLTFELDRIMKHDDTVSGRRALVEEHEGDLGYKYLLAEKLGNCGDHRSAGKLMTEIREADPHGETPTGAKIVLRDVWGSCQPIEGHEAGLLDTAPVSAHLASLTVKPVAFDGFTELGNYLANSGEPALARAAFRGAWPNAGEDGSGDWAYGVANYIMSAEDELSDDDRTFVIELASVSVESSHAVCEAYAAESKERASEGDGDGDGGEWSEADQKAWVAERLDLLARAQFHFGDSKVRKQAVMTARQAAELAPENEEYVARAASFSEEM